MGGSTISRMYSTETIDERFDFFAARSRAIRKTAFVGCQMTDFKL